LPFSQKDVEKLVKFYTSAFGLKMFKGIGTATYLSDGHMNLAIIPIELERKIYKETGLPFSR
jgi:hypothetical protein